MDPGILFGPGFLKKKKIGTGSEKKKENVWVICIMSDSVFLKGQIRVLSRVRSGFSFCTVMASFNVSDTVLN